MNRIQVLSEEMTIQFWALTSEDIGFRWKMADLPPEVSMYLTRSCEEA